MKKSIRWFIFIMSACMFLSRGHVCAQDAEKQIIEYLAFRETDIKDILRQLAKQYNLNIVFSEQVRGLVTVELNNVSIEQAMDAVITVNGFVYNKKENVYKVTTQEEAGREGKQTKLFKLNNADSARLKETLSKILSSDGSCEADGRSNSLLVTDSAAVINKIENMMPSLDEITPQVLIEAKFIETSLTNTETLGIDWTTTISASGASRPTAFPFDALKGGSLEKYLPQDAPSSSESTSGSTGTGNGMTTTTVSDFPTSYPYSFPYATKDSFTFGTLDFTGLKAVFDCLKKRSNTKLVANPRVVTLNSQEATINVGKVLSLPKYERNDTTGNMEISGWESMPVGVTLVVTPQISPDGHIRLKLRPEVSSLTGYASTRDGVNEGPITSSRKVSTEVQILDGETVVIGGLVKEESLSLVKKVPLLGDIPVLGYLFKTKQEGSTGSPNEKTDLLIFVTARIIKDNSVLTAKAQADETVSAPKFKLKLRDIKSYRIE
ncbi:MAG: secretin N-terminal domain-containing protein [Candidatus Omnitrophica bacterium]|nr:secretin N-terminal domain-containing protein [Candidatus Omnitrophota bacterium]